jgi:hypothetical protein
MFLICGFALSDRECEPQKGVEGEMGAIYFDLGLVYKKRSRAKESGWARKRG